MLFTKEIAKINFDDVVSFCKQQIPEGVHLDYKKDFPTNLEKTISAFANTTGGLIIIGVEDKDSKPKPPFEGLQYKKGFRERVNNIILSNIYPPVFPEIQVCNQISNKTFVIIRVPQSNMTPHYIRHKTQIYIRTDDISHPEELATADQIEWLRDRRKKSEELREFLYDTALSRYNNYLKFENLKGIPSCETTISIAPLYPTKPYKTPHEIKQLYEDIKVIGYKRIRQIPYSYNIKLIQGGVANFSYYKARQNQRISYIEINQFGLIYYKDCLGRIKKVKIEDENGNKVHKEIKITYLAWIIELIDLFLEYAVKFYERLGYWGLLEFKFSLDKLFGVLLLDIGMSPELLEADDIKNASIDDELKWQREYYVYEIRDKRPEILIKLIKDISWSLGFEYITGKGFKNFLKENKRLTI